jgi:hypothetical protein
MRAPCIVPTETDSNFWRGGGPLFGRGRPLKSPRVLVPAGTQVGGEYLVSVSSQQRYSHPTLKTSCINYYFFIFSK